jgi:hypothetical protein
MEVNVKTLAEILMVLLCVLFWSVALPLVALVEFGVLIGDRLDAQALHEAGSAAR